MSIEFQKDRGVIALIGALLVLTIFALVDAYAVHNCFSLAHNNIPLPDICDPNHIFRTALEIGGMAIGLYGVAHVVRS